MTFFTSDGGEKGPVKHKYRGKISFTNEMLEQGILGLPESVKITKAYTDDREITHFILRSDEPTELTVETGEAMEIPGVEYSNKFRIKKAIRIINSLESADPDSYYGKMYRKYLLEVLKEDYNMNIPSSIKVYVKMDIFDEEPYDIMIENDEIVTAEFDTETFCYYTVDNKNREVVIGHVDEEGKLSLIDQVILLKED